jgi:predicted lipoprotein with Yx(FWY)xxD motif
MRSSTITPFIRITAALGAILLTVAACSSSSGASSAPSVAASTAPSAAASTASGGESYTIAVASGSVGAYLTGEDGKTLYTFTPDSANTSTCVDACAAKWPPFTVESDDTLKAGDGVTGALTTFARADGKMQVAYGGKPLYYFAADSKAGDTTGQGVGGKWYVATPSGAAASPSGYNKGTY